MHQAQMTTLVHTLTQHLAGQSLITKTLLLLLVCGSLHDHQNTSIPTILVSLLNSKNFPINECIDLLQFL